MRLIELDFFESNIGPEDLNHRFVMARSGGDDFANDNTPVADLKSYPIASQYFSDFLSAWRLYVKQMLLTSVAV